MTQQIYCTAPFNGLTIREDGHVRTCCAGKISLGNLNEISINDIEQSPVLKKIQQDMLSNYYHYDNCRECIDQEKNSGVASLRQHYLKFYPSVDKERLRLKSIDIRWNNTCNLGCLYCCSQFSSIWADRLQEKKLLSVKPYQEELLDWILQRIDHVDEIMLVGGEPMLMKQNYALLAKLPAHCKISIITNLSYDLKSIPCFSDLLQRPPELIAWNLSMENIGEKFEYVRSNGQWSQVEENLTLLKNHWPESVSLNMVYNLFSAFDLPDTIDYFHRHGIKKFNIFPVGNNPAIEMSNFSKSIKLLAAEKLKQAQQKHFEYIHIEDRDLYPLQGANMLLESMLSDGTAPLLTLEEFDKKISWYDRWGKKKFIDLWPDLYHLIRSQLNRENAS